MPPLNCPLRRPPLLQQNLLLAPHQSRSSPPAFTPTAASTLPTTSKTSDPVLADPVAITTVPTQQGNFSSLFPSPVSNLPPLSQKLMKNMKEKEYVDLSTLLPNSLYDTMASPSFSFKVQPGSNGDESVSLTQTRRSPKK